MPVLLQHYSVGLGLKGEIMWKTSCKNRGEFIVIGRRPVNSSKDTFA